LPPDVILLLKLKCTTFDFGSNSAPDPAGGAYSAHPDLLAGFKGPTCKGRDGRKDRGRAGEKGDILLTRGGGERGEVASWR